MTRHIPNLFATPHARLIQPRLPDDSSDKNLLMMPFMLPRSRELKAKKEPEV